MTSNTQATPLADQQPELHCNLLFSLDYGQESRCWRTAPLANTVCHSHEVLIAQNVPYSALLAFNYQLSCWLVRPALAQDACKLWQVFEALYQVDPENFEGKWQFICQHYKP